MTWPEVFDRHFNALFFFAFFTVVLTCSVFLRAFGPDKKAPTP